MQFTVKSHTNPNQTYTVTFPEESTTLNPATPAALPTCTCKGFGYRGMCSHIKEAAARLEQLVAAAPTPPTVELDAAIVICPTCGVQLLGTHHKLDKCPACYREATFGGSHA